MRSNMRERVERGVQLLDDNLPDWRDRVDPIRLDLRSCYACVLGQLFDEGPFAVQSGFMIGIRELGLHDDVRIVDHRLVDGVEHYGFVAHNEDDVDRLTNEWVRHLSHTLAIA